MSSLLVLSQWDDLPDEPGIRFIGPGEVGGEIDAASIEMYAPRYTGGALDLHLVPALTGLRVLQLPNAGFEDALSFVRPGLTLCNARGVHDASTSELALTLLLASLRGIPQAVVDQAGGTWNHVRRSSLADRRVGVLGMGAIGGRIARLLEAFEAEVVGFTRSGVPPHLPVTDLDAVLPTLDALVLIAPLTPETHHIIDTRRMALLKDGAVLVNVGRGGLIDTDALVRELHRRRIHAALDVVDPEPLPHDHPLWQAPQVLITPHVGGDTTAFEPRMRRLVVEQARRLRDGEALHNVVAVG